MKLLLNIKNNSSKIVLLFSSILFLSCSDYLDVNADKDNPTVAPLNYLLTGIQVDLNETTNFLNQSGSILQVYTHQMTVREEQDQYGTKVNNPAVQNDWLNLYLTLSNIETLINQAEGSEDLIYVGLGQIQKAYLISVAVDLWGDVPFSEANQLKSGIIAPKFDNQKEIYTAVFELIETAKTNLSSNKGLQPRNDDLFYKGDTEKWIRFANTFKLKLYNQLRLTDGTTDDLFDESGFNALITENNFFESNEDDFEFKHTKNLSPTDERNKLFLESYKSSQFTTYISPWFYEILMGMNPNIHTDNKDPRIKYYFYNQLSSAIDLPPGGDPDTGNPKADYWDASTGFFSIRFGSQGPWRDFSYENSYTYPGIFPCGGRYDDGQGEIIDATMATGVAPHRILTYDEFLYIQAELIQTGILSGNAEEKLTEAMNASFAKVDQVVANSETTQIVPSLAGSTEVSDFMDNIITEFTAGDNNKKLEIIMTQKWVATFGDPMDQYTDYRRTGFPILANPNSTSKEYQLDNQDVFPLDDSETVLNTLYPLSFFWPQNELNVNKNAPTQKTPGTYNIFWDLDN